MLRLTIKPCWRRHGRPKCHGETIIGSGKGKLSNVELGLVLEVNVCIDDCICLL